MEKNQDKAVKAEEGKPRKPLGRVCETEEGKKIKIDLKDRKILSLLSQDSRTPLTQIAHQVQLSRDAVNYRIKRLERLGVILRFFPIISLKRFGYYKFRVFLQLDEVNPVRYQELIDYIKKHPNLKYFLEYSDRWDLEVDFVARDMIEFDRIIMDIVSKYPEVIMEKEVLMVIKTYMTRQLPLKFMDKKAPAANPESSSEPIKIDDKDMMILDELLKDCRESSYKIAEKVGLSADGVGYRIKKMIEMGVIKQFTILANLSYLKYDWYTFAINVKKFDKESEAKFAQFCASHPYIIKAERTMGTWDFLLYMATESPRAFHQTIKEIKTTFSSIIKNYTAYNAYIEHYYTSLPRVIIDYYLKQKK